MANISDLLALAARLRTLENVKFTSPEIDLIIGAVNKDGKVSVSKENYRLIRAEYATTVLISADLTDKDDELRQSVLETINRRS